MPPRTASPSIRQWRLLAGASALVASAGALAPPASVRVGGRLAAAERETTLGCATDFDSLVGVARRDYAGYQLAVQAQPAALSAITDTARRETAAASDARVCEAALARWLAFFRDGHLHLVAAGLSPVGPFPAAQPVQRDAPPDPAQPSIVALDSGMLLLRIPSFDLSYKLVIDSLLAANAARLARTPALVIDVRANGGGGDAAFAGLIPLLYTSPIRVIGADAWASSSNTAYYREILNVPELPASDRALVRRLVAAMERSPNRFIPINSDSVLRLSTVRPNPRTVAVLIDGGTGSTAEEFLLQARQSRKVTLFGREPSAGALDYANTRQVVLPSGRWRIQFGTSRSRRLPANPVDPEGIVPAVRIPSSIRDDIDYVRGYLNAAR